jgi:hypothetical protein
MSQPRLSELERGLGGDAPVSTWIALGLAIRRPLAVSFSRELERIEPSDAGHLAGQEVLLGLARQSGRRASFELPTRPSNPSLSVDALVRDDHQRVLVIEEVWNRLDDLGAATRTTDRKVAEAKTLALMAGGDDGPYGVSVCWVLVDTVANRLLLRRFPEAMRARFPGSSPAWVAAIEGRHAIPTLPGLVWFDPRSAKLRPTRLRLAS